MIYKLFQLKKKNIKVAEQKPYCGAKSNQPGDGPSLGRPRAAPVCTDQVLVTG